MSRRPRPLLALLLAGASAACSWSDPPPAAAPAEVERIARLADEMRAVARAADARRTAALEVALQTLEPRPDLGPCPINVPIVGTEDMKQLGKREPADADVNWRSIRAEQMMIVKLGELATTKSVRLENVEKMLASEQSSLNAKNAADVEKWLRRFGDVKHTSWEMVIVADQRVDPAIVEQEKFRPGIVLGRTFVYSHLEGKVVCAGRVAARSSPLLRTENVTTKDGKDWHLVFDLENETYREAARKLSAAGPVRDDAPSPRDAGAPKDASRDAR